MGDRTGEPPALRLQDVLKEVAKQARELISHANFKLITRRIKLLVLFESFPALCA